MTALGPLTYAGSTKRALGRSISCIPNFAHEVRPFPEPCDVEVSEEDPDESRASLYRFLHGVGRFIYLILLLSLGIVLALIQTLHSRGHVPNCLFEICSLCLSSVLLGAIIFQLSLTSRRQHAQHDIKHGDEHEELNVILRIGLILFSLGAIVLSFLRIIALNDTIQHMVSLRLSNYVLQIVFYTLQTYVAFKYKVSHFRALNACPELVRFILIHLVAVNLNLWFNTVVLEATEIDKVMRWVHATSHNNASRSSNISGKGSPAQAAQTYFFPCVIEYTIVVSGVLINLYFNLSVEEATPPREMRIRSVTTDLCMIQLMDQRRISDSANRSAIVMSGRNVRSLSTVSLRALGFVPVQHRQSACDKAHTGLFCSLVLCAFYAVYLASHFFFDEEQKEHRLILLGTHLGFHALSLMLVLFAIFRMLPSFRYVESKELFVDNFLMTISFFAIVINSAFVMAPLYKQTLNSSGKDTTELGLNIALCLLDVFQYILQTVFLLVGVHLRAATEEQRKWKPGSTVLLLLIAINIMTWFEESLLYKTYNSDPAYIDYYGQTAWSLITSACKPLVVFYRCHAAAMLAEIWSNAYKREASHED